MLFFLSLSVFVSCLGAEEKNDVSLQAHQKKSLSKEFVSCRQYADEKIFSYCIYQKAGVLDSVEDVNYYCSMAGKWEEGCRHTWGAACRARLPLAVHTSGPLKQKKKRHQEMAAAQILPC